MRPAAAQPFEYRLDPTHSFAHVLWQPTSTSSVRLRFERSTGSFTLDRSARSGSASVVLQTAALSTGSATLDARIKAALDVAAHPQARFEASRFVFDGNKPSRIEGTLALRGTAQAVVLQAQNFDCYFNPLFKREVCGGDFEADLDPAAWGLGTRGAAPRVKLLVAVEGIRQ